MPIFANIWGASENEGSKEKTVEVELFEHPDPSVPEGLVLLHFRLLWAGKYSTANSSFVCMYFGIVCVSDLD